MHGLTKVYMYIDIMLWDHLAPFCGLQEADAGKNGHVDWEEFLMLMRGRPADVLALAQERKVNDKIRRFLFSLLFKSSSLLPFWPLYVTSLKIVRCLVKELQSVFGQYQKTRTTTTPFRLQVYSVRFRASPQYASFIRSMLAMYADADTHGNWAELLPPIDANDERHGL